MANLRRNAEVLRGLLPEGCRLMPAVKANAYGHGAVPVARELNAIGVRAFCVASAERNRARKGGVKGVVLVLGIHAAGGLLPDENYRSRSRC
jgi:serine/alanine racemase